MWRQSSTRRVMPLTEGLSWRLGCIDYYAPSSKLNPEMPCYLINSSMTLLKTQSELNRRIRELDGLRGIAVILVVIAHYQNMLSLPDTTIWMLIQHTINVGWLGVDIFFVLSGYLITSILLEHNIGWQRFYTNRAFRILPAFIVVFSITIYFFIVHGYHLHYYTSFFLAILPYSSFAKSHRYTTSGL